MQSEIRSDKKQEIRNEMQREVQKEVRFMEKKTVKQHVCDYLLITVASAVYAAAISFFLDPNSLAPGGVTGIAIILNRVTGMETGTWMLLINIPILLLGCWKFGVKFILSTLYCTATASFFTNIMASYGPITTDPLLAAIVGGALFAVSMGWVLKTGATTGGTDIIIKILRVRYPHMKTSYLFLVTDAAIVAASAFVFKNVDRALYAGLVVFVASYLLDVVLYGRDEAKLIYIISDNSEEITKRLLEDLDLGVTHVHGMGAYSGKGKNVIMCAMRKNLAPKVEEVVKEEDPLAFMIITSATEIYGKRFKSYFSQKI